MKKERYIVEEKNIKYRKEFYNFIVDTFELKVCGSQEQFVNNIFPFVVDFKTKRFWVCDSIAILKLAEENDLVITIDEFMDRIFK